MPVTVQGTVTQAVTLQHGLVFLHPDPLKVNIDPFKYDIGGQRGTYAGVLGQSITDDDTSYVYLDADGTLNVNTTGWPTEVTYLALARVVAASGEIVAVNEERVLLASSAAAIGTCRIGFPVDSGVRGDGSSASSNNSIASITFPDTGSPRNRWNFRPPQNYTSGNLTLRLLVSVAGTPGSTGVRWQFDWGFGSSGDSLPSSYPESVTLTKDMSSISNDTFFDVELTIPSADFDNTEDMMYCWLFRDSSHAGDDCTLTQHLHLIELQYTGYKVAGQAGQ